MRRSKIAVTTLALAHFGLVATAKANILAEVPTPIATPTASPKPASPQPATSQPATGTPVHPSKPAPEGQPVSTQEVRQFRQVEFRRPELKLPAIAAPSPPLVPVVPSPISPAKPSARQLPKQAEPLLLVPDQTLGLTVASHPTFFAWFPKAGLGEFVVMEAGGATAFYRTQFTTQAPGFVRVTLPKTAPPLAIGKTYWWYFSSVAEPKQQREAQYPQGQVQRIVPSVDLEQELTQAAPGELPAIYAQAGLWYDTIAALAMLRRDYPQDIRPAAAWADLLHTVNLDRVATIPFVEVYPAATSNHTPTAAPLQPPAGGIGISGSEAAPRPEFRPPARGLPGRPSGGGTR